MGKGGEAHGTEVTKKKKRKKKLMTFIICEIQHKSQLLMN